MNRAHLWACVWELGQWWKANGSKSTCKLLPPHPLLSSLMETKQFDLPRDSSELPQLSHQLLSLNNLAALAERRPANFTGIWRTRCKWTQSPYWIFYVFSCGSVKSHSLLVFCNFFILDLWIENRPWFKTWGGRISRPLPPPDPGIVISADGVDWCRWIFSWGFPV